MIVGCFLAAEQRINDSMDPGCVAGVEFAEIENHNVPAKCDADRLRLRNVFMKINSALDVEALAFKARIFPPASNIET